MPGRGKVGAKEPHVRSPDAAGLTGSQRPGPTSGMGFPHLACGSLARRLAEGEEPGSNPLRLLHISSIFNVAVGTAAEQGEFTA